MASEDFSASELGLYVQHRSGLISYIPDPAAKPGIAEQIKAHPTSDVTALQAAKMVETLSMLLEQKSIYRAMRMLVQMRAVHKNAKSPRD